MIIIIINNTSKRAFILLKAFFPLPLSPWILAAHRGRLRMLGRVKGLV